jgi:hypothetical protein
MNMFDVPKYTVNCGRDGHKGEFCFKKKREERMAEEWANKDKYHPSNGVLEPHVQMPRAKEIVRTVRLGEIRRWKVVLLAGLHRPDRCTTLVRLVKDRLGDQRGGSE